jgi:hypothetical protein
MLDQSGGLQTIKVVLARTLQNPNYILAGPEKARTQATGECYDETLYSEQPHENREACELTHMHEMP